MLAALALGYGKSDAARFSFLLAVPTLSIVFLGELVDLSHATYEVNYIELGYVATLSFISAISCIHFFLKFIEKIGFVPFGIYRLFSCWLYFNFLKMNHPYVSYFKIEEKKLAQQFADRHELTLASPRQIRIKKGLKLVIWITKDQIFLQDLGDKNSKPFILDFRLLDKEKSDRGLIKKCFSKFDKSSKVFDLTAGFCQDAYCIANLGFEVTAYEKESWLFEFTKNCLKFSKKEI